MGGFLPAAGIRTAGSNRYVTPAADGFFEFSAGGFRFSNRRGTAQVGFPPVAPSAAGEQGSANYFEPSGRTAFPQFDRLTYAALYPGIDLVLYGDGRRLEYDFRVAPHADAARIALDFPDARSLRLDTNGDLIWQTAAGELRHRRPVAYQTAGGVRQPVDAAFVVSGKTVRFQLGPHDRSRPLIVDPVLLYSDMVGGSGNDAAVASAMDSHDNLYIFGQTTSSDFPAVGGGIPGATVAPAQQDLFLTKWDPIDRRIIYSSYLGGNGPDTATALALDPEGDVYLAASAGSTNMPVTSNAAEGSPQGQTAGYIAKISADGSRLLYASYFNEGQISAIASDAQASLYVTGTASAAFQPTAGAAQSAPPNNCTRSANPIIIYRTDSKVFVEKWKPDFSGLSYASFLDGSCGEYPYGLAVDTAGSAWIAGTTYSPDFPTTVTAVQPTYYPVDSQGDFTSGFVAALSPAGDRIAYGSFFGNTAINQARAVAFDSSGSVYVTGSTWGLPFPTGVGAAQSQIQTSCNVTLPIFGPAAPQGGSDAFVFRLNPTNVSDYNFTYLGGSCDDAGMSVALDSKGNVWVAGTTSSGDFPTVTPYYGIGTQPGFVAELADDLKSLLFSSFAPQSTISVDSQDDAVVVGTFYGPPKTPSYLSPRAGEVDISRIDGRNTPALQLNAVLPVVSPAEEPEFASSYGVAPGEMVRIAGQNLGPQTASSGQMQSPTQVATQVDGIQVLFDGVPAPLMQLQAQQILAMAPFALNGLTTTQVTVVNGGEQSNSVTVGVLSKSPVIVAVLNQDLTTNSAQNPALLGSVVTLYVTGLGQTNPAGVDGQVNAAPLPVPVSPVQVARLYDPVGDSQSNLAIAFQASAYGLVAGITQINVQLPAAYTGANPSTLVLDDRAAVSLYYR